MRLGDLVQGVGLVERVVLPDIGRNRIHSVGSGYVGISLSSHHGPRSTAGMDP